MFNPRAKNMTRLLMLADTTVSAEDLRIHPSGRKRGLTNLPATQTDVPD
jgi:hypothetical protein